MDEPEGQLFQDEDEAARQFPKFFEGDEAPTLVYNLDSQEGREGATDLLDLYYEHLVFPTPQGMMSIAFTGPRLRIPSPAMATMTTAELSLNSHSFPCLCGCSACSEFVLARGGAAEGDVVPGRQDQVHLFLPKAQCCSRCCQGERRLRGCRCCCGIGGCGILRAGWGSG